jgi:hypothetical protein
MIPDKGIVSISSSSTRRLVAQGSSYNMGASTILAAVTNPATGNKVTHDVQAHVLLGDRAQVGGTNNVLWQTYLNQQVKPFPNSHALHGAEIESLQALGRKLLGLNFGYSDLDQLDNLLRGAFAPYANGD